MLVLAAGMHFTYLFCIKFLEFPCVCVASLYLRPLLIFISCFSYCQLLYVDSLDISGLGIVLPGGRFAVTIWSKEDIATVLKADLQNDEESYGKLEVIYFSCTFFLWITSECSAG